MNTEDRDDIQPAGTATPPSGPGSAAAAAAPAPLTAPASRTSGGSGPAARRILLVEDNDDARSIAAFRLEKMELVVTTARDGKEACELAFGALEHGEPYDWILMDMQMPVVDGYEAVRSLRSRGYNRPIIAMTAYALERDRSECLEIGCDDHVTKPIDWTQLAAVLKLNSPS